MALIIRELSDVDTAWGLQIFEEHWGGEGIVSRGVHHLFTELPGFVAEIDGERVGLITYNVADRVLEIISLNSLRQREGIGQALVEKVLKLAEDLALERVWLVTTNDNLNAQKFYQKRGFRLVRTHLDAVSAARKIKPGIPLIGEYEIPLRDEFEFELSLK